MNYKIQLDYFLAYRKKWIFSVLLVLTLILYALGYILLIKSQAEEYRHLQKVEARLKKEFEKKYSQATGLTPERRQLHQLNQRLNTTLRVLNNNTPKVIEKIFKLANKNNLTIDFFSPLPEVSHSFYVESPINLTLRGQYHGLVKLLNDLLQLSCLVGFDDFEVSLLKKIKKQRSKASNPLVMKIKLKIYRALSE
jgi:type IV pilus assembly protein PilO